MAPLTEHPNVLDQVEERLLTPLNVIEQHHQRRSLLEQLAERQAISPDDVGVSLSPRSEASAAATAGSVLPGRAV